MATVDERRQELGDGVVGVTVDQVQAGHCALNQSGADLMRKELRREVFHESAKERMLFSQGGWQTEQGGVGVEIWITLAGAKDWAATLQQDERCALWSILTRHL